MRILAATAIAAAVFMVARAASAAPRVTGCVNVQDFGADPTDSSTDDAAPIRSAIAAALATSGPHVVCIPGGVYNLLTTTTVGSSQVAVDLSGATDLSIVGEGPATVLQLGNLGSAVQVFYMASGSARIQFEDLLVDGSKQTTPTPATSLFRIGDGSTTVSDITLDDVHLVKSAGVGVVIDGSSSATSVTAVSLRNGRFAANQGSAIKILQGAERILVTSNYFGDNLGLEIEANEAAAPINGLVVDTNVFAHATNSTQPLSISLTGPATTPSQNVTFSHNIVAGGRIAASQFSQVVIAGNAIVGGTQATGDPELFIGAGAQSVSVANNIVRRFSCTGAPVVQVGTAATAAQSISVAGNSIVQAATSASCPTLTVASAVQVAAASNIAISGNHVSFAAAAPTISGIVVGPVSTAFSNVNFASNTIDSISLAAAIEFGGGTGAPPLVVISDNTSRGATTGVRLDAMSSTYIPLIANNRFDQATSDIALSTSNPAVAIHSNLVGPSQLTGAGSPETHITAPVGSLYFQTDATAHGLWVKESGTGNTGWQSKN